MDSAYPPPSQDPNFPPQQPSYPPQQPGYPPEQQGYPPQQPGYPPQGYPPQDYPPQQPGYPSQGYPPQSELRKDAPPPYYDPQQPYPQQEVQQQTATSVVVVQQQPAHTTRVIGGYGSSDHYLILSIINLIFCCLFGSVFTLLCTIPAIFSALQAQEAERQGYHTIALYRDRRTISLNVSAFIFGLVVLIIVIVNAAI